MGVVCVSMNEQEVSRLVLVTMMVNQEKKRERAMKVAFKSATRLQKSI